MTITLIFIGTALILLGIFGIASILSIFDRITQMIKRLFGGILLMVIMDSGALAATSELQCPPIDVLEEQVVALQIEGLKKSVNGRRCTGMFKLAVIAMQDAINADKSGCNHLRLEYARQLELRAIKCRSHFKTWRYDFKRRVRYLRECFAVAALENPVPSLKEKRP